MGVQIELESVWANMGNQLAIEQELVQRQKRRRGGVQEDEEGEEDEGYSSVNRHQSRSSRRARWEEGTKETILEEGQTIEEIKQRFSLLREAYEEMRDQMTRIEFEADLLKDEKVEREEEMRLQKAELMKLVEVCSVLHE